MPDDKAPVTIVTVDETVNYRDGFNFDFEEAGHVINVHCSSVSGKESIYLDDQLIASKRSFKRRSSMSFNIGEDNYEIEFNVVNMFKGETHCTLIKNDVHVKTLKKALLMKYQLPGGKNASLTIFAYFVIGVICGFVSVRYIPAMFGG
jgi:hypothetical protein